MSIFQWSIKTVHKLLEVCRPTPRNQDFVEEQNEIEADAHKDYDECYYPQGNVL